MHVYMQMTKCGITQINFAIHIHTLYIHIRI